MIVEGASSPARATIVAIAERRAAVVKKRLVHSAATGSLEPLLEMSISARADARRLG
jgi:hypothetical protein